MMTQDAPLIRPSLKLGARSARPPAPIYTTPPDYDNPAAVPALIERAKACLANWGEFASCADRMRVLSLQATLDQNDFYNLRGLIEATDRRARKRSEKLPANTAVGDRLLTADTQQRQFTQPTERPQGIERC